MSEEYHRGELAVALDPSHPSHILPPPIPATHKVLDIGCGAGQTMIAAYPDRVSYGLDIDLDALRLGLTLTQNVRFACGRAEALPWRDGQFDMVVSRVTLVLTDIRASLKEIRRVLKNGGQLWITLHPFSVPWSHAKARNYKGRIFFCYIVLNSLLFHLTGRLFPFLGRYESFQTEGGITRALRRAGFDCISIKKGRHYLVTARTASLGVPGVE